jgi:phosphatidyl-myo-inositol dimannoside synthase
VQRILLITRNLPPLLGGMERLNWHMAKELARNAQVHVIGPRGARDMSPPEVKVREAPLRPLAAFLLVALWRALREALICRPNTVLAGSGLTAPLAWLVGRICRARVVVYVHGLDIAVPNLIYRCLWLPAIRRADRVIANSRATASLAEQAGVTPERIGIVHPGVDLPENEADGESTTDFRSKHRLADRPLLLSVGRLTRRKGLLEFVANVLPGIVRAEPRVLLLIVGDAAQHALHGKSQTLEAIQAAADAAGVGQHLYFLGKLPESELRAAYRASDVHVFPIRRIPGDPEGFGMVAIEAAAHGLPTVAYASGGVVDAVSNGVSGCLVEPEDTIGFASAVLNILSTRSASSAMRNFASRFSWENFGNAIRLELDKAYSANARS